jgi:hypothetical protein
VATALGIAAGLLLFGAVLPIWVYPCLLYSVLYSFSLEHMCEFLHNNWFSLSFSLSLSLFFFDKCTPNSKGLRSVNSRTCVDITTHVNTHTHTCFLLL